MKTTIHYYFFDTHNPTEKAEWEALSARLKSTHPHAMEAWGERNFECSKIKPLDGQEIDLETTSFFDNQWNTAPTVTSDKGLRVFDWQISLVPNAPHIREGHYLDQTDEMRAIRANTLKCGYCGKMAPAEGAPTFCPHCIDSEYLKEADLPLTRLLPVSTKFGAERQPLTEDERAEILPRYKHAQIHGATERGKVRIAKERADIESKFRKVTENAKAEHDGFLWLIDHGININNVIYYSHSGEFSFGWRSPISQAVMPELLGELEDFPFPYNIKGE